MRIKSKFLSLALAVVVAGAGILMTSTTTYAATANFNFDIGTANTYDSHCATKAGGSKFENCAYITPSYFSKIGNVWFWIKMKGQSVQTEKILLSYGSEGATRHMYYTSTPTAGLNYHVGAKIGSVSSGNTMNVRGAFTP